MHHLIESCIFYIHYLHFLWFVAIYIDLADVEVEPLEVIAESKRKLVSIL